MSVKDDVKLGPTGKFPEGKLNKNDDGQLQFAVFVDQHNVIINFDSPVMWVGMDAKSARELAKLLVKYADQIEK